MFSTQELLLNISAISWRPVLVVEEARVPRQPPTIGKQLVNFIIRVYGIKHKIFHEQILIKSSMNETLVLSIWIRIRVPNFPSTTAWDHTSDPSSKSAMCPNGVLAVGCIPIGSVVILIMILLKVALKHQKIKNKSTLMSC
jgi:hypothetical protein